MITCQEFKQSTQEIKELATLALQSESQTHKRIAPNNTVKQEDVTYMKINT